MVPSEVLKVAVDMGILLTGSGCFDSGGREADPSAAPQDDNFKRKSKLLRWRTFGQADGGLAWGDDVGRIGWEWRHGVAFADDGHFVDDDWRGGLVVGGALD